MAVNLAPTHTLPLDIRPRWLNVIRRLQSASAMNQGIAVLSINIVVQANDPLYWTSPKITLIEPRAGQDDLVRLLTERDGFV